MSAKNVKRRVVLVGAGAVGSALLSMPTIDGLKVSVIDRDVIEEKNLQVQNLYSPEDVGHPKALAARRHRPDIKACVADLNARTIKQLFGRADLIVDATDNFQTRHLINMHCRSKKIPWIHAAAVGTQGVVWPIASSGSCFSCVYAGKVPQATCETAGLLPSAAMLVAAILHRHLLNAKDATWSFSSPTMWRIDALEPSISKVRVRKNPVCAICNGTATLPPDEVVAMCGRNLYQLYGTPHPLETLKAELGKLGPVQCFPGVMHFGGHSFFEDGRVLMRAPSARSAKSLYAKLVGS